LRDACWHPSRAFKPSTTRNWQAGASRTPWAEIDYRTEFDYTVRGALRPGRFHHTVGSPWIAHPVISFQFGHQSYVAASIETPKDLGKEYSAVRRSFRHCESEKAHVSGKARAERLDGSFRADPY